MNRTIAMLSVTLALGANAAQEWPPPIPEVLNNYTIIQTALADDSLQGVPAAAQAITKALAGNSNKILIAVSSQAEATGKAHDIETARAAFKELSSVLLRYLGGQKIRTDQYQAVYCDMAKAHWLQTDKDIKNPYYGKSMLKCGKIIGNF